MKWFPMGILSVAFFGAVGACLAASRVYDDPAPGGASGYAVTVDGARAVVSDVRNSAMPVNVRWPGHQRDLDQTEIGGLVRFEFDGTAQVEVTAPRESREVKIRPAAKGVKPVARGRTVAFELTRPGVYSVEFDGIHSNLLVLADAPAAYKVAKSDPQTLYYGPGAHEAGLIELKSGQTLYIHEDAVVFGRVFARHADNIRILGRGILDGSHIKAEILPIDPKLAEEQRRKGFAITNYKRYDAIRLEYCDDVLIDGITVRDSPLYNIRPIACRGLTIRNVKLCGNWRYNSDGIDMHNCENVRISDCFIRTFDDCICVKGFDYRMDEREMLHDGYLHDVFTNAVIERCTVWCDWGKSLEIGAETRAREISDITFRDCDVIRCDGAVCDIQNCDYADIHDITFENIRIEQDSPVYRHAYSEKASAFDPTPVKNAAAPVFAAAIRMIPEYSKNDARRGRNRDVTLRGIHVTGPVCPWITLSGYDKDHRTTGVTVRGLSWNGCEVSQEVAKRHRAGSFADPARFEPVVGWTEGVGRDASWPLVVVRHTRYLNNAPDVFAKLIACHRRHPGACDEFWFSTGARRSLDEMRGVAETIASFRPLCDEVGIKLSIQQATTLGHTKNWMDGDTAKFPESAMQQDRNGNSLGILCPRAPEGIAYERACVKLMLSVAKPHSYWLDDDMRLGGRPMPNGCFCPRCVKAFNEETGGAWTRQSLAAAVFDRPGREPVRAAWSAFNARSLAMFAAAVRDAADEVGGDCRLAVQVTQADAIWSGKDFRPMLEALSGPSRRSVGIRPGAGYYLEEAPRGMIRKSLSVAREAERCRDCGGLVGTVCYEEDNYPWRVLHKSPGAIMTEGALALASGCDSLSLYWYSHAAPEPIEEYDRFLRTLAKARPYFERLAASVRRTRLGGVARFVGSAVGESREFNISSYFDYDLACAGIPVTVAESGTKVWYVTKKSRDEMTEADKAAVAGHIVEISDVGKYPLASRRTKLLDDLDAVTRGAFPVRVDECRPLRILPRVRPDGKLDSVTLLNLSVGDTDELRVRVRNPATERAVLRDTKGGVPAALAVKPGKAPNERIVELRNVAGWQICTIFFE